MPLDLSDEKSAMAYLEQATEELSKDIAFTSEKVFQAWLSDNFKAIVERASELNLTMLEKVLSNSVARADIVDKMARNIHATMNK